MNRRFEVLAIDLFGPLPEGPRKEKWILIIEDTASRWVELFPLEAATAAACGQVVIEEVFLRFGLPRRLISDNGTQFISAIMQQITHWFEIDHHFTPVYHPAANPVERKNRDLKAQLAIQVGTKHTDWPSKLPAIRFAINSAYCTSTGTSPAYLTFGRELRTPTDIQHDLRQIMETDVHLPDITTRLTKLIDAFYLAKERHEKTQDQRKIYADKRRKPTETYRPGELVWVDLHTLSKAKKNHWKIHPQARWTVRDSSRTRTLLIRDSF